MQTFIFAKSLLQFYCCTDFTFVKFYHLRYISYDPYKYINFARHREHRPSMYLQVQFARCSCRDEKKKPKKEIRPFEGADRFIWPATISQRAIFFSPTFFDPLLHFYKRLHWPAAGDPPGRPYFRSLRLSSDAALPRPRVPVPESITKFPEPREVRYCSCL